MGAITFNADEIFEMAVQIERNGIKFYRKAAESFSDQAVRKTLLDLAEMEVQHEKVFAEMRKEFASGNQQLMRFDPDDQAAVYLQAMADGHVFDLKEATVPKSLEDILKKAIEAEKDSIVFYLGVKDYVPPKAGKDKVEAIIEEEKSHIVALSKRLEDLK